MQRRVGRPCRPVDPGSWMGPCTEQGAGGHQALMLPLVPSRSRRGWGTSSPHLPPLPFFLQFPGASWHSSSRVGSVRIFSGQTEEGEMRSGSGSPGRCLFLLPASALPRSASRWGAAHPCTCRAISSGPSRHVVAYFLSSTAA